MNFMPVPARAGRRGALRVRLGDSIGFPVPADRTARYQPHVGKASLMFGLRPEHIIETAAARRAEPARRSTVMIDVAEPMGMETLVYFTAATAPRSAAASIRTPGAAAGKPMKLRADLSNMHLIDDATGKVL